MVVQFNCAEDGHLPYGSPADDSSVLLVDFHQNEENADNSVVVVPFDKCTSSSVFSPELFCPPQAVDLSLQPTQSTPVKAIDVVNMPEYISSARSRSINVSHLKQHVTFSMEGIMYNCKSLLVQLNIFTEVTIIIC